MFRMSIRTAAFATTIALLVLLPLSPAMANDGKVLVQGAPLVGGANGMFFNAGIDGLLD